MYVAIDTSSDTAGLAVVRDGRILAEITWRCGRNHTVELLPHLESLLRQSCLNINDTKGIIVARGPGSFNGLRVGLGTAKGLAFSLGIPITGICTLEAAAYQHAEGSLPVCAVFTAGKGEIAYATYQMSGGEWRCLTETGLTTIDELCEHTKEKTIFCGEPTDTMLEHIRTILGDRAVIPPAVARLRRPGFLAVLGEKRLIEGVYDDAATLQPIYLRRPHISPPKSRSAGALPPPADCKLMAVIWDMDGTIVDTAAQHFQAWQTVFGSRCVAFNYEDFRKSFGLRNDDIIRIALGLQATPEDIACISREKTQLFREAVLRDGVIPMPGAINLITGLHKRGIIMAIASSAPKQNVETFLKMLNIESLFKIIVSGQEVTRGKPDPQIFLLAAEKLNIEPCCCAVIEDAVGGVAGARTAGMCCVGVAANHPRESLKLANLLVDSLSELNALDIEKLVQTCNTGKPKINGGNESGTITVIG
jgi:tRNA threonylcarbamoyl adenosine modification protein YeaZ